MLIQINPLVLCILPLAFFLIEARTQPNVNRPIVFPKDDDETGPRFAYPNLNWKAGTRRPA